MIRLDKPKVIFKDHFENCIKNKHEPLRENLRKGFGLIEEASKEYEINATNSQLFSQNSIIPQLTPVTTDDLVGVYENQMVNGPGRKVYFKIRLLSNLCSFCDSGISRTLDHYLPKSKYPEFSIFPLNLVPCCRDCNSEKNEGEVECEEKQFLHPYFDDVSSIRWLEGEVSYVDQKFPVFTFFVNREARGMEEIIYKRLKFQFEKLKINGMYSIRSASRFSGIGVYLNKHYKDRREIELKTYLNGVAGSLSKINQNSWEAAMYRSMSNDDQFCQLNWEL